MPGNPARAGRFVPLVGGFVVAILAAIVLSVVHHRPAPAVSARVAVGAALHDAQTRRALADSHWTSVRTETLDSRTEHVAFFAGAQIVAEVLVQRGGQVAQGVNDRALRIPYGNWLAYQPALLVALCAMFVLMAAVSPWRRVRNLDVVVIVSLTGSVVLFQHRYLDASVLAATAAMLYLFLRCAWRALTTAGSATAPSVPLLIALIPRLDTAGRIRWLRVALVVFALVFLMVSVSSTDPVDVIYAAMEGATRLVHGVLPYGHMPPGIVHGDTYPILTYALYAPLAWVAPVATTWDSVDGGLAVAALAALGAAWTVFRSLAGQRSSRPAEAEEAGLRAALAWLAFPPLLITASTGTTDVVLAAALALAILLWRRPAACAAMLSVAGWFKLAPFALVPLCLAPLRGRRLGCALATIAGVSAVPVGLLLAFGGVHGAVSMLHAISYQFSRGSLQSIWTALGLQDIQPLAQASVLGLLAGATIKLRREPHLASDRARLAALAMAILTGMQLSADYWAFLYLVWIAPLVILSLLAEPVAVAERAAERAGSLKLPLEPAAAIAA